MDNVKREEFERLSIKEISKVRKIGSIKNTIQKFTEFKFYINHLLFIQKSFLACALTYY